MIPSAIRDELEEGRLEGVSDGLESTTYLQGSYRNTTMVYGSGDVDILVIRTDVSHADFAHTHETSAEYVPTQNPRQMFEEHAEGVYRTLQAQYGTRNVERGDKAIEVNSEELPLGADVVLCLQYRRFWPRQSGNHMKGIVFWTADGMKVVNFPRRHRIMGEQYNRWCDGNYKPTVRVLKNFRNALVENGTIEKEDPRRTSSSAFFRTWRCPLSLVETFEIGSKACFKSLSRHQKDSRTTRCNTE